MKKLLACSLATLMICTSFTVLKSRVEWLNETSHDFGTIKQNQPVSHIFKFKNISDTPLTIDNVRTTCGCTAPEWDESEVILPDSTGKITLAFDAKAPGYFYKMAKVWINGQKRGEKLFIEGEVIPENNRE